MQHTLTPITITERFAHWNAGLSVDRQQRMISNVALAGTQSRNGYAYTTQALRDAVPLYENKPVFLDHPADRNKAKDRSTRDLAGSITNVRFEDERIRGDIRVLESEAGQLLLALADQPTPGIGMSHVVVAERSADGKTVERIHDVLSVDAVTNPATTTTFRESASFAPTRPAAPPDDDLQLLRGELATLREERRRIEEKFTGIANQLEELRGKLQVQHLIDTSNLPREAITAELRLQLESLPNDQSRRRLLHSRSQLHRPQTHPRSNERSLNSTSASNDELFLTALRRK